jgi:hypothetical protein
MLLLIAGTWVAGVAARETTALPGPDSGSRGELLRTLDAELQRRFLDTSRGFGAARVMTAVPSPHRLTMNYRFVPENDIERDVVSRLAAARIDLVFYLGGSSLPPSGAVTTAAATPVLGLRWRQRPELQGPVTVLNNSGTNPPAAESLLDDGRRTFVVLRTEDVVQFSRDGWEMVARPVRAANGSCVVCHNGNQDRPTLPDGSPATYKVGDVLGVLLYAMRR